MYAKAAEAGGTTICSILAVTKREVLVPLTSLLVAFAVFFFLWGVVEFIAGASDEKARTTGKTHMMWGIFGLIIIAVAAVFIEIFQNFFGLSIPGGPFCPS